MTRFKKKLRKSQPTSSMRHIGFFWWPWGGLFWYTCVKANCAAWFQFGHFQESLWLNLLSIYYITADLSTAWPCHIFTDFGNNLFRPTETRISNHHDVVSYFLYFSQSQLCPIFHVHHVWKEMVMSTWLNHIKRITKLDAASWRTVTQADHHPHMPDKTLLYLSEIKCISENVLLL